MDAPIVSIEFQARDFAKLKRFYTELFGWEIGEPNEWDWAPIRTGSTRGAQAAMTRANDAPEGPSRCFFYVQVDDLRASLAQAERLGGKTVVEPWDEIGLAVFLDPEGNRVGLLQRKVKS